MQSMIRSSIADGRVTVAAGFPSTGWQGTSYGVTEDGNGFFCARKRLRMILETFTRCLLPPQMYHPRTCLRRASMRYPKSRLWKTCDDLLSSKPRQRSIVSRNRRHVTLQMFAQCLRLPRICPPKICPHRRSIRHRASISKTNSQDNSNQRRSLSMFK